MGEAPGSAPARSVLVEADQVQAVRQVADLLRRDLTTAFSLQDLADIAYFSPSYFNQLFRSIVGIPPLRFHTALRIQAAKRLLVETDLRATDICLEVGYRSTGSFTTRFTELVGLPPGAFRRLATAEHWSRFEAFLHEQEYVPGLAAKGAVPGVPLRPAAGPMIRSDAPVTPQRPLFVGLYLHRLPEGRPVAHAVAFSPTIPALPPVRDGSYHVLAVSFRWWRNPRSYLVLDERRDDLLVGSGSTRLAVRGGVAAAPVELRLRPPLPTDPPVLTALAHFLTQALTAKYRRSGLLPAPLR